MTEVAPKISAFRQLPKHAPSSRRFPAALRLQVLALIAPRRKGPHDELARRGFHTGRSGTT